MALPSICVSVIWRVNTAMLHSFNFFLNNNDNNRIHIITSGTCDHFIWFFNMDSKSLGSSCRENRQTQMDGTEKDWSKLSLAKEETSIRPAGLRVVGEILEVLLQPSSTTPCMVTQSRALWLGSILFLTHISATSFLTAPTHELEILFFFFLSKLHWGGGAFS